MRPGTPGFGGMRLREAREARGISASSLAELIGVSRQVVSQYETTGISPSPTTLYRIAATLNLPLGFFSMPARDYHGSTIFFRSMSAVTKVARVKAASRLTWLYDIVQYLQKYLELPAMNVPFDLARADFTSISQQHIEEIALETRRYWKLGNGPISNVTWLLENHGVIVARAPLEEERLDALSSRLGSDNRPYVFLTADKESAARSRFDLAHELGHVLLHDGVDQRHLQNTSEFKLIEEQAYAFASALLMPAPSFMAALHTPTLEAMRSIKSSWGVSIGAMIMRAKDLGLITDDHAQKLWISRARRGWSTQEPLDDTLPPERPRVLRLSVQMLVDEHLKTKDDICSDLQLHPQDITVLAALDDDFFTEEDPPIRLIDRARAKERASERNHIVAFPR